MLPTIDTTPLNPPVVDPRQKRRQPELLPVLELRADAGVATFPVKSAQPGKDSSRRRAKPAEKGNAAAQLMPLPPGFQLPAGARPNRTDALACYHWVVITGLIPLAQQIAHFNEAYRESDGYVEERDLPHYTTFLVERQELPDGKWAPLDKDQFLTIRNNLSGFGNEVVRSVYTASDKFVPNSFVMPPPPLIGQQWGANAAHPPEIPVYVRQAAPGQSAGEQSADAEAPEDAASNQNPGDFKYRLFRFFDLTVEPAKQYSYRVTLQLLNSSAGMSPHLLEHPGQARGNVLRTPASEPSPPVTIPRSGGMFAGPVTLGRGVADVATAKILVSAIHSQSAIEATTEIEATRGTLLNRPPAKTRVIDPHGGILELDDVEFRTDTILLDFQGGGQLGKDRESTEPADVLIAGLGGKLEVHSEVEDAGLYRQKKVPAAPVNVQKDDPNNFGLEVLGGGRPGLPPAKRPPPIRQQRPKRAR